MELTIQKSDKTKFQRMQMNLVLTKRFVVVFWEFNKVKQAELMVIGINFTPMAIFFHLILMEYIDFQQLQMNLVLTRRNEFDIVVHIHSKFWAYADMKFAGDHSYITPVVPLFATP